MNNGQPIQYHNNDPKPGNVIYPSAQVWQLSLINPVWQRFSEFGRLLDAPEGDVVIDRYVFYGYFC